MFTHEADIIIKGGARAHKVLTQTATMADDGRELFKGICEISEMSFAVIADSMINYLINNEALKDQDAIDKAFDEIHCRIKLRFNDTLQRIENGEADYVTIGTTGVVQ